MNKEEFLIQGWDLVYLGPTGVKAWGSYMVHLRHATKGMVSGYGITEQEALADAAALINKPAEVKNEIHH